MAVQSRCCNWRCALLFIFVLACLYAHAAALTETSAAATAVAPAASSLAATTRRLLQTKPGNCPTAIPACQNNQCVTSNGKSICQKCKSSYQLANGRLHCICPKGTFEKCFSNSTCSCVECGQGFYCPGGNTYAENGAPAEDRGQRFSCVKSTLDPAGTATTASVEDQGLTTKLAKSTSHTQCITMPGWVVANTSRVGQTAARCTGATFHPGGSRPKSCYACKPGMEAAAELAGQPQLDVYQVCRVPAGKFINSFAAVQSCLPGSYRSGQGNPKDLTSKACNPCPVGYTTVYAGASSADSCNIGAAGYQIDEDTGEASLCPYGTFYSGGQVASLASTCDPCPFGTTTKRQGAKAVTECVVPPGYFVRGNQLAKCPTNITVNGAQTGFYRSNWVSYLDATVREPDQGTGTVACKSCGTGIMSALTEEDEMEGATTDSSLVAKSSEACYILPGMGMFLDPLANDGQTFKAVKCPANAYGSGAISWGFNNIPCKPCPPYMQAPAMSTSFDDCKAPAGYSYTDGVLIPCQEGFYREANATAGPCKACPPGRTTKPDSTNPAVDQASISNCYVAPGMGLYFPSAAVSGGDPWGLPAGVTLPTSTLPSDASGIVVMECPAGSYGLGGVASGTLNSLCTKCPTGFTTSYDASPATDASACNVCARGYGDNSTAPGAQCTICDTGYYQAQDGGATGCAICPTATFTYNGLFGSDDSLYVSPGTTLRKGSVSMFECVARANQLPTEAGQSFVLDTAPGGWTLQATSINMSNCIATCPKTKCCFAQMLYNTASTGTCKTIILEPLAAGAATSETAPRYQMYYKLLPTDAAAALSVKEEEASVHADMLSSARYMPCDVDAWAASITNKELGTDMAAPNNDWLGNTEGACQELCDNLADCYGFFWDRTLSRCLLRSGATQPDTRSFFAAPHTGPAGTWTTPTVPSTNTTTGGGSTGGGSTTTNITAGGSTGSQTNATTGSGSTANSTSGGNTNSAGYSSAPVFTNIITICGFAGVKGSAGDWGVATSAYLNSPHGIAVDSSGNIYIADSANHCVRKIDKSTGLITTVAGKIGQIGNDADKQSATYMRLSWPWGVAVDAAKNLYITDHGNYRVLKVDAVTGIATRIAGNGGNGGATYGASALNTYLGALQGVAVDSKGNVFFAHGNHVARVDPTTSNIYRHAGTVSTWVYTGDGVAAYNTPVYTPGGLALETDNLLIADTGNGRVRSVDASTQIISTVFGIGLTSTPTDGLPGVSSGLDGIQEVAVDKYGNYFTTENKRVRAVVKSTGKMATVVNLAGVVADVSVGPVVDNVFPINATMRKSWGIAIDINGDILVSDADDNRIRRIVRAL